MITIKPSPDNGNDPENTGIPELAANSDEHKKRIPLVWIPATLVVGLLIAAIYLGGRIVKAHPQAPPEIAHPSATAKPLAAPEVAIQKETAPPAETPAATETAPPSPSPAPAPAPEFSGPEPLTVVTPDDGIPMITPQSREMYIQVGALDQEATRRFVQRLRDQKLTPHVATGPTPQLMRVLIGPFDNREALNERKAQLESEGIETFVRQY